MSNPTFIGWTVENGERVAEFVESGGRYDGASYVVPEADLTPLELESIPA